MRKANEIEASIKTLEKELYAALKNEAREFFENNRNNWFEHSDAFYKPLEINNQERLIVLKIKKTYRGWEITRTNIEFDFGRLKKVNHDYYQFGEIRQFLNEVLEQLLEEK